MPRAAAPALRVPPPSENPGRRRTRWPGNSAGCCRWCPRRWRLAGTSKTCSGTPRWPPCWPPHRGRSAGHCGRSAGCCGSNRRTSWPRRRDRPNPASRGRRVPGGNRCRPTVRPRRRMHPPGCRTGRPPEPDGSPAPEPAARPGRSERGHGIGTPMLFRYNNEYPGLLSARGHARGGPVALHPLRRFKPTHCHGTAGAIPLPRPRLTLLPRRLRGRRTRGPARRRTGRL